MGGHFKIVCGACQCSPGLTSDPDGEFVVCPRCGQRDSVDEAFRVAGEHHGLKGPTPNRPPITGQTFKWQAGSD